MPKNVTPKQNVAIDELFANGFDKRKALDKAQYAPSVHLNKVFDTPKVKAEIELRQKSLARKHNIEQDQIIQRLADMFFFGAGDLIKVDKAGEVDIDWKKFTDRHRAGVKSFTQKTYKDGKGPDAQTVTETKVEFVNPISSQDALSKHLGLFEKGEGEGKDLIDKLLSARRRVRMVVQIDADPDS